MYRKVYQWGTGYSNRPGTSLEPVILPERNPGVGEVRIRVTACGVCRTDLHVVDGELAAAALPIIPGHEIVGRVDALGEGVTHLKLGQRVGVPWLGYTCGVCIFCTMGRENLCDRPLFTGYTRDGGYATSVIADARYTFDLGEGGDDASLAPLLCAGLIGWRSLVMAGDGQLLGLYGFGAAAHALSDGAGERARIAHLRDHFEMALKQAIPETVIFGVTQDRLCSTSCFAVPGLAAETALIGLDLDGVAMSSGSTCSSGKVAVSHVLAAMGVADSLAAGGLRASFGWSSTMEDVAAAVASLVKLRERAPQRSKDPQGSLGKSEAA